MAEDEVSYLSERLYFMRQARQYYSGRKNDEIYDGALKITDGIGGSGGQGGAGGQGGTGGNTTQWGAYCGWPGGGGSGGYGGAGGNGGNVNKSIYENVVIQNNALIYFCQGIAGQGGQGGKGGAVGSAGHAALDRPSFDSGTDRSNEIGSNGLIGVIGGETSEPSVSIITSQKVYRLYDRINSFTYHFAKEETNTLKEKLVSIGSLGEQSLINEMIAMSSGGKYWIGLSRNRTKGFNIFDWEDGSTIKIEEDTFGATANVVRIDNTGNTISDAYSNFFDGEPNDKNSCENYICLSENGWIDVDGSFVADGYITEANLSTSTTNTLEQNTIAAGGICGCNNGTISSCHNIASVEVGGLSEKYGISALSCGICGINNRLVENCYNSGEVTAQARTNSSDFFSDAYAKNTTYNAKGSVNNSNGSGKIVADAISGNGLSNGFTDIAGMDFFEDATAKESTADVWNAQIISVDNVLKTEYLSGDIFNKNNLILTLSTGTVADCNYYCVLSRTGNTVAVVKNGDSTRYVPVTVLPTVPDSICVIQKPKQTYIVNEDFTTDGMILELTYNTGITSRLLTSSEGVTVLNPDMSKIGRQSVGIVYIICGGAVIILAAAVASVLIIKKKKKKQ